MGVLEQARKMRALTELPDAPSFTNRWAIQRQGRPFLTEAEYKRDWLGMRIRGRSNTILKNRWHSLIWTRCRRLDTLN